jgi:transporter family-2 protein
VSATRTTSAAASAASPKARSRKLGLAVAAIASGVLFAVQGRINGALGADLGDGILAAVMSFAGGLVVLLLLATVYPRMRAGLRNARAALAAGELRTWHCLGGVGGAMFVASQSITVGVLGVAMFTVGVVAGQTVSGLLVDKVGLGPSGPRALTASRIAGAVLTLAGVGIALSGGVEAKSGLGLVIFPLVGGISLAVQQAINGRVAKAAGSSPAAALANFAIGTTVLLVASLVAIAAVYGLPDALPTNPLLYLGGPVGAVFICAGAYLVAPLGVLVVTMCIVAGQLIGSVLLDLILPTGGEQLTAATVIGAGLTLVAVAIASLSAGRRDLRG